MVTIIEEGRIEVGLQLPIQAQSTMFAADWEKDAGPIELAEIAKAADELGFFYIGVCDHTAIPRRLATVMSTVWYDTVATLGWLAGITKNIRLLSHVLIAAERHPLRLAKELSTLDKLSGGRLIVGVGAGHVEEEYEMLCGNFNERGKHTDESITALKQCFENEFPVLKGPHWIAEDLGIGPRPVQTPRPPIWVGGSSGPALRRAALMGDGWLPQGTRRKDLLAAIETIKQLRDEAGIEEPIAIGTIAEPIYICHKDLGDQSWELPRFFLKGGPEQISTSLREFGQMGVSHIQLRFMARSANETIEQMAAFSELVMGDLST